MAYYTSARSPTVSGCIPSNFRTGWSSGSLGPCTRGLPWKIGAGCWTRTNCRSLSVLSMRYRNYSLLLLPSLIKFSNGSGYSMSLDPNGWYCSTPEVRELWPPTIIFYGVSFGFCRSARTVAYDESTLDIIVLCIVSRCLPASLSGHRAHYRGNPHIFSIESMYPSCWWSSSTVSPDCWCLGGWRTRLWGRHRIRRSRFRTRSILYGFGGCFPLLFVLLRTSFYFFCASPATPVKIHPGLEVLPSKSHQGSDHQTFKFPTCLDRTYSLFRT